MGMMRPNTNMDEDTQNKAFLFGGIGLIVLALLRRNWFTAFLGLIGAVLALRGTGGSTGLENLIGDQLRKRGVQPGKGINVEKQVTINRSPEDLYAFWRNFANLPSFMRHLESVTVMDDRRSHWVAKGAGMRVEWDAEVVDDVTNRHIGWRSVHGSDVDHVGSVHFHPARGGFGTQVRVNLKYDPPAGTLGEIAIGLLGDKPGQMIEEDLRRFKETMEAMETSTRTQGSIARTTSES